MKIERIMEHHVKEFRKSEWEGVDIKIVIRHPKIGHSVTSRMQLDRAAIDDELSYLTPLRELSALSLPAQVSWAEGRKRAVRRIEQIGNEIAHHVMRVLEKELQDK